MILEEWLDRYDGRHYKKSSFRENKGLGNEVGYHIFDYPAEEEVLVRERIEYIRKNAVFKALGVD